MYLYLPNLDQKILEKPIVDHLISLRPNLGESFFCTDLKGNFGQVEIVKLTKKSIEIKKIFQKKAENPLSNILCQAIIDKAYLEKLFEVLPLSRVSQLHLFYAARSTKLEPNLERLNKILIRSCEQSQTCFLPNIKIHKNLEEMINFLSLDGIFPLVLDCQEQKEFTSNLSFNNAILVGPEGGWTQFEQEYLFQKIKLKNIYLGQQILPAWIAGFRYFSGTR